MKTKIGLMFSIFSKKTYLIDLIEGITDFHNHILPGIDDGAQTLEDSIQLVNAFENLGIRNLVATPHVMGEYYPNTPATINSALKEIKAKINSPTKITAAAEYMMDQYFTNLIENNDILTVIDDKVLVEMSYFQAPINLNEILFNLQNNSFSPILAHPERYAYLHSRDLEKYKDLKNRGCRLQLNMLSLSGHYGDRIQKTAFNLMENNLIDFISSDVHKIEHIEKIKKIKINKTHLNIVTQVTNNNKLLFAD